MKRIADISELGKDDIPIAGGKAANLGELVSAGFNVPSGFVLTTASYDYFVKSHHLEDKVNALMAEVDVNSEVSLKKVSAEVRALFENIPIPSDLFDEVLHHYQKMWRGKEPGLVAVRSSATAEDLPTASFAGQQDTYLNVGSDEDLIDKVKKCWSSLFTPRAIAYRVSKGFDHSKIKLAVVVQKMVHSDVSGIMFTVDPNSEKPHIIIEAGYGLGEAIVGGQVTPDTYVLDKFHDKIINKKISKQTWKLVRGKTGNTVQEKIPEKAQKSQKLDDEKILALGKVGKDIEVHYDRPMDIEWCLEDGEIFVVQARPVTTLKTNNGEKMSTAKTAEKGEDLKKSGIILVKGLAASPGRASGPVRFISEEMNLDIVKKGDIMVTAMTSPDMVPAMTRAAAIVTDEGGMTCHAAIVARELGIPCIVGTSEATEKLHEGM
ncbi:MAG TPA: PEP/pyruvate-binding domain-containing protein, partial [Methanomassiliicoccales archaeon]|nr:PEP/pyruvate-binding domain-containing protein [Methanomassiliicoccales archaeon]